ncbi:MAG TPA: DEAD/DEAH box helicase [Lachnospiraceae bacterium]|nr:DEAD/DEAH box helicase [Lachnospiraceae bacterium]
MIEKLYEESVKTITKDENMEEKVSMQYEGSNIDSRILRAIQEMGYENMTPIQEMAIPALMENGDVIGQAQTGTGKTAAFGIPMLQKIEEDNHNLQGVILCPTRELAIQAAEELRKYSKYMHGIKMVAIYGGQDITRQIRALKDGAQIIVGTPGRVMDHMRRRTIKLDHVKMVVLDEADEMLNMGFREDMETILSEIKQEHQTALFSATMPQAILDITDQYQNDATLLQVSKKELTISLIKQYYFVVKNIYKEETISRLLETYGFKRSLIFCNTKRMVDELSENLKKRGYQAEGLHGDMTQGQRDFVMNRFKSGNLEILIATDVAARGIDVDDLEAVFNYDIPQDIEYYIHRIGRTGRAGKEGMAFTFAYGRDLYRIREIERISKSKMTEMIVPKADQIMDIKLSKALKNAAELGAGTNLNELQEKIEEKIAGLELDPMVILTALIKMQIGDKQQEIVVEDSKSVSSSSGRRRSDSRTGSRSNGEGRRKTEGGFKGERRFRSDGRNKAEGSFRSDGRNKTESPYKSDRSHDKSLHEKKVVVRRDGTRAHK